MVFESVIVDILNKYLKPYVKRLDSSQLNLGVWKGEVRVEKLELKEDLFAEADLDVPIRIRRSYVGKLEAHIPWKKLTKEPIELTIDEVYIILGPDLDTKYDAEQDLKRRRKEKTKKIKEYHDALKKRKQKKKEAKKGKKKKGSDKPDTFAEKLAVHMTKNLQVKVRDIHVRYEDDVTNPSSPIAAGLTLHSLNLKSTDGNWVPCVVRETATLIYKLIELNCLGLYWNTSCVSSFSSPEITTEQMIEAMRSTIARPSCPPPPTNSYLLNPMSASAKLKLNLKPGVDLKLPQLLMGLECDEIAFSLQQDQMKTLMLTIESYDRHVVNQKYLKYKPGGSNVSEDPGGWWRYAINAVLEEDVKRRTQMWSWTHIKKHRAAVKLYVDKYREKLHSINPSSSLHKQIQELEDQLDWFNILVYREEAAKKEKSKSKKDSVTQLPTHKPISKTMSTPVGLTYSPRSSGRNPSMPAVTPVKEPSSGATPTPPHTPTGERRVVESSRRSKKSKGKGKPEGERKGSIFSRWKQKLKSPEKRESTQAAGEGFVVMDEGGREGATVEKIEEEEERPPELQVSPEEEEKDRQELYKAIGYSPDEEYVEYPKEYVAHEIHVLFNTLTLELLGKKQKLGVLKTNKIKVDVLNRPSSESVSVKASVGMLQLDGVVRDGRPTPMITSDVKEGSLIDLQLEINPLDRPGMDVTVNAVLRPLQITYDFDTVNGLIEMFKPPNNIHFQELTNAASASWEQLKLQTTAGLQDALKDRKQIDLDISLHSPYLIVPEGGNFSSDSHLIVVDLGQLKVFGCTKDPKLLPKKLSDNVDLNTYYDKFSVSLAGMQVLVAKPGEDWRAAMAIGSSPLHIIDPTGFEIALLKSMIRDDALLATMKVEGTIQGFEVKLSDTQLATVIKVAGTMEKPPAMINTSQDYDELPTQAAPKMLLDDAAQLVELDTISLMSVSSFGDEEDEECSLTDTPPNSLSPTTSLPPSTVEDEDVSRNVFTDVSIKLIVNKVSVKLTQTVTEPRSKKGQRSKTSQNPLLDILIRDIRADVVDRKWDTQGSVAMREVAVLDHITPDTTGDPTYLLKTECLNDGNFISARFVTITQVGRDFAAKYTGLEDSLSAQLSLVKLRLHRSTLKTILEYVTALKPVLDSIVSAPEDKLNEGLETIDESEALIPAINKKDFEVDINPITKEFHYDVQFEGIDVSLVQDENDFLYAGLTGFSAKGSAQPETVTVVASIKDLTVKDVSVGSSGSTIITKADNERSFVLLNVIQYNLQAHQRDPHKLDWVDTSLKAEVNRVNVSLNTAFMGNVLEFVKKLEIDKSAFESAAKATAETATVTANAIIESTKSAHRLKLDLTLHAPVVELPFTTDTSQGNIYIDLGEFQITSNLKHGHDIRHGSMDSDCSAETLTLLGAQTVLDCMDIRTTSIQIYRKSHPIITECQVGEPCDYKESHGIILEPLKFTASIARNISLPTRAFPNVDISLNLEAIKLHLHEEDVQAFVTIGLAASRITEVVAQPPKPKAVETRPRFTTTFSRPKRDTLSTIGRQRTRTRAGSRLKRFHTYDEVTEVRVEAKLDYITLDLTTNDGPLLEAGASGLKTKIDVLQKKVLVSASTTSLNVSDLSAPSDSYSKIVSIVEETDAVSTVQITVYTEEGQNPLSPLGKLQANIAQIQLFIPVPFVLKTVMFVQRLGIDKKMLETASKTAQDGATAVSSAAQDKYFAINVKVQAPVLIIPTSQEATQGLMVDLGSLSVENTLLEPAENVGIDAYGLTLKSFKISRVLLDPNTASGSPVLAERTLLQPFDLLLAVERNLCPWYTKIPTASITLNMNDLKIFMGSDDLKQFAQFGMGLADQVTAILPEAQPVMEDSLSSETSETSSEEVSVAASPAADSQAEAFEFVKVLSKLAGIEIKLFKDEPKLSATDEQSKAFSEMEDYALGSLQLVTMAASVKVSSSNEVEVKASLKDISLCDLQKDRQGRITGNRVIQHYTRDPLKAYTGQIERPLVSIQYVLREDQHIILFTAEKLLILSDIEFMKTMTDYFKAVMEPTNTKKTPTSDLDETLKPDTKPKLVKQDTVSKKKKKKSAPIPKLKVNASIKNFRVAVIENVDTPQPQALTLKVSTHVHVQISELSKQVSLSVADLGISTSSFFDLDNTTSWVLLPCSMSMSLSGPIDKPAMNIQAIVEPISLTLSPAIVRLIIHAVQTLLPEQEDINEPAPAGLWDKKLVSTSGLWFFSPVKLHTAAITDGSEAEVKAKGEALTVTIESVEVYLESESVDNSPGNPVLALTVTGVAQLLEWTGDLSMTGTIQCEASYYNEVLSVWEPLLEPLENKNGTQQLWEISLKMDKKSPKALELSTGEEKHQFSLEVAATSPLQLTLTKMSLQLIKTLVEAYSKDYGKQVQGSVKVDTLTGAPFTFINKLGNEVTLFLQPGPLLKLKGGAEFFKLNYGQSVDMYMKRDIRKRSYASLVTQNKKETPVVDIAIGNFRNIKNIPLDTPGEFYYTLIPKTEVGDTYGIVIEVAVTGEKKTITARSPIQFNNQLLTDVDLLSMPADTDSCPTLVRVIKSNEIYPVPINIAELSDFLVRPTGFGFESEGPPLSWKSKQKDKVNMKCMLSSSDPEPYFIRVNRTEECYRVKRHLPKDEYAHHVFHLHPPLVVHNLLPYGLYMNHPSSCIEPGNSEQMHYVNLDEDQEMSAMVLRDHGSSLHGKFTITKQRPGYINFYVAEKDSSVELSVHIEDDSYLKIGVFCPFWMVNKTDLTLIYKDGDKLTNHPRGNDIVLLSTSNKKNKIQLCAITNNQSRTDPTKSFSLNAIGSSGNFTCKLGDQSYKFGVEIRLSQFTLTKLVIVTPYYLLVNETKFKLEVYEESTPRTRTTVSPEEVIPFWPLTSGNKLVVVAASTEEEGGCSVPFNYQSSDFTVLQFHKSSEVPALCLEVQESESATVVTFSPYYPGCVPVQIINHFPDLSLQFSQDSKSPLAILHTLQPGEMMYYTWDDPSSRKVIKWNFPGVAKVSNCKPIDVNKDSQDAFNFKLVSQSSSTSLVSGIFSRKGSKQSRAGSVTSPPPVKGLGDTWLEIDEDLSEQLVSTTGEEPLDETESIDGSISTTSSSSFQGSLANRGYWKSFIDGLQRVVIFTPDDNVLGRIRAENSYSVPLFEASLSLRSIGLSLVDNNKKRELAYIAITQSGIIWQIDKGKGVWKTVNTSVIEVLEQAYQAKEIDIKDKNLVVNLETMQMFKPIEGKLRRTHHDGVYVKFSLSEKDYSVQAKIGYVQVDNQLPFSVYPQVLYPLPPPPTVASTTEPKPFVEASLIIRKNDQSNGYHFKYVHVLIQKMAVNVDLGFILSLVDFFSFSGTDPLFQTEYVESDMEYVKKSLKETVVPELAEDFNISRSFFDVLHLAPIKVTLSFNIRSVGKNKSENEITAGDRLLELFLHSIGVILTSVQETEMKFSLFHLEYQPQTGRGLTNLLIKHYRNQLLFQLHTLIFGLDVLGNPVSVVRGVVEGAIDLFYEPIKGSVLGPEEFFEGLGLGLRSFFGAGVVGGITGASARITGAVGDVFAKLSFDNEFINKRQQQKAKPPKMGSKLGGFAKNLFEGVTGVVTQPVKGLQKEGAVGLLKGTGRGLVGLIVRPTGGLVDLASGTLSFVTRKTQIGNFEIADIRPPRFIGRNGVVNPYSPQKAIGTALLVGVDEGKFVETDYYHGHVEISNNPYKFVLVTDRRFMIIERRILTEGWKSVNSAVFEFMSKPVESKDVNVVVSYNPKYKDKRINFLTLSSEELALEVTHTVNDSYLAYVSEQ